MHKDEKMKDKTEQYIKRQKTIILRIKVHFMRITSKN